MNQINSEQEAPYITSQGSTDDEVIASALAILSSRISHGDALTKPQDSINYLQLNTSTYEREVFSILTLDNRHRVINFHSLFFGTLTVASIHPREVVKTALADNAANVILSHNHPSGDTTPSKADRQITKQITDALALVDIRTLDHIITGDTPYSFANNGLI